MTPIGCSNLPCDVMTPRAILGNNNRQSLVIVLSRAIKALVRKMCAGDPSVGQCKRYLAAHTKLLSCSPYLCKKLKRLVNAAFCRFKVGQIVGCS